MSGARPQTHDWAERGASDLLLQCTVKGNLHRRVRTPADSFYQSDRTASISTPPGRRISDPLRSAHSPTLSRARKQSGRARRFELDSKAWATSHPAARVRPAPADEGWPPFLWIADRPTRATQQQVEAARQAHMDARSWRVLRPEDTPPPARDFLPSGSASRHREPLPRTKRREMF